MKLNIWEANWGGDEYMGYIKIKCIYSCTGVQKILFEIDLISFFAQTVIDLFVSARISNASSRDNLFEFTTGNLIVLKSRIKGGYS